mgnify:CR=1 FL=1
MKLSVDWYKNNLRKLQENISLLGLDAMLILDPYNLYYLTGFYHQATERHLGLFVTTNNDLTWYVPMLEKEMAEATFIPNVKCYFDYPGKKHGILWMLEDNNKYKNIGIDNIANGRDWDIVKSIYPEIVLVDSIYKMRMIKTYEEIAIIKKDCDYSTIMINKIHDLARSGLSEIEIHNKACKTATDKLYVDFGQEVISKSSNQGIAYGSVLIGKKSAFPDAMMDIDLYPSKGDVISCTFNIQAFMYESETAKSFIFGNPENKHKYFIDTLIEVLEYGLNYINPGIRCCDLSNKLTNLIQQRNLTYCMRYRIGNGKGLERSEKPWIDAGDKTLLQPGMIITLNPGLFEPGIGGFRICETVLITNKGCKLLTNNYQNLQSFII